ncbi:Fc.00g027290.m01.CDS01 [Cosmosporella sp. VM-42]
MESAEPSTAVPPPIIDISRTPTILHSLPGTENGVAYFGHDAAAQKLVVEQIRDACLRNGFFQIINHGVPVEVLEAVFEQSKDLFNLPIEEKMKYSREENEYGRGYERLRSQNFEKKTEGDLKEGFYLGRPAEPKHFSEALQRFSTGPNVYPPSVPDPEKFKTAMERYHEALTSLSRTLLTILARTLSLPDGWFDAFAQEPIATLRLLHYPPQGPDAPADERGIGAHTDFGGITILMQDDVGGLEVYDRPSKSWMTVTPTPGAFVVNLGNLMMRWTDDRYISNVHRVINQSGKERYSVPFFFSGNPDYLVECIPGCEDPVKGPKYPPVRVQDWMDGRFADTYGGPNANGVKDLVKLKT